MASVSLLLMIVGNGTCLFPDGFPIWLVWVGFASTMFATQKCRCSLTKGQMFKG